MVTYWLKLPIFLPLSHSAPSVPMFPLEFRGEVNHEETSHGAILQWRRHDRSLSRFDTVPACDGQTVRQTNGFTIAILTKFSNIIGRMFKPFRHIVLFILVEMLSSRGVYEVSFPKSDQWLGKRISSFLQISIAYRPRAYKSSDMFHRPALDTLTTRSRRRPFSVQKTSISAV